MKFAPFVHQTRTATVIVLFTFAILSVQAGFGQGLKMTQLSPPNSLAGNTFPLGMNQAQSVVGSYLDSSTHNRLGFMYSAGKYRVINPPTAFTYARANGINDANEVVGDFLSSDLRYHGFIYAGGTYTTYDETTTESCGIFGVNSAGDFVGDVGNGPVRAFANIKGAKKEFLPGGAVSAYAYAINTADKVVGTYYDASNNAHGFSWVPSGAFTKITYPGSVQTQATGINDAGEITGTYTLSSGATYGFTLISGKYTATDFADTSGLNQAGAYDGFSWGVPDGLGAAYLAVPQTFTMVKGTYPGLQATFRGTNNAGSVVGDFVDTGGNHHGLMISGGLTFDVDDPKGVSTICRGINSTGTVVGDYYDTSGLPHGFQYALRTFTDIPGPGSSIFSEATGINDAGDIVGDYYDPSIGSFHGFILKNGVYQDLAVPGAFNTFGGGINANDEVTLWWLDAANYQQSDLFDGTKYTLINVPGAANTLALGINKTGQIAFTISDPYGESHAALKKGTVYSIIDFPKGSNTNAGGINDAGQFVGSYIPAGQTVPQPFKGK